MFYTGIGSRALPDNIIKKFETYGASLAQLGFTLRSGAAHGADEAFEDGCDSAKGDKEIYLPWKGFNNSVSELFYLSPEARELAGEIYGPRWKYSTEVTKKFMTRNMYQISGTELDNPSSFVVCWTPDGCSDLRSRGKETGGTGQAIAYADEIDIPIFNLRNENAEAHLFNFIAYLTKE